MTAAGTLAPPASAQTRRAGGLRRLNRGTAFGLGVATIWLSLLVLLPLAAVVLQATEGGWGGFWDTLRTPAVRAALRLTIGSALVVTVVNVVMGTLIAWVLIRDPFPGRRIVEVVIDLPFALPTIVAGLVLLALYGPRGALGVDVANSRAAVLLALLFVTLPFVVRAVQPVLLELDREAEAAAASLGASRLTIFRRIILPNLVPAIAAGAALSFARAIGEYGSVVLISGNLPLRTEVASVRLLGLVENDNLSGAAAVAVVLLAVALLMLVGVDLVQRWAARHA